MFTNITNAIIAFKNYKNSDNYDYHLFMMIDGNIVNYNNVQQMNGYYEYIDDDCTYIIHEQSNDRLIDAGYFVFPFDAESLFGRKDHTIHFGRRYDRGRGVSAACGHPPQDTE